MSSYANELMKNTSATPTGASTNNTSNVQTGSQNSGNTQGNNTYDENSLTAQLLRDQNWKALYDTKIQLANARALGQKYYQNEIANGGFNTQGYGSSMAAAQNNSYANALAAAEQDYYDREMEITQGEIEGQTEIDNQIVQYLNNAATQNAAYNTLINYGLLARNQDGSYSWTDQWNNLDQTRQGYILSALETAGWTNPTGDSSSNAGQASEITGTKTGYTFENLMSQTVGGNGWGKNQSLSESTLENGFNAVNNFVNNNGVSSAAFKVTNSRDPSYTEYLLYSNGAYYRISQEEFESWTGDRYRFYGEHSDQYESVPNAEGASSPQEVVNEYSDKGLLNFKALISQAVVDDGMGKNKVLGTAFEKPLLQMSNQIKKSNGQYEDGAMFLLRTGSNSTGYALVVYLGNDQYALIDANKASSAFNDFNGPKVYINGVTTSDVTGKSWGLIF